MARATAQRFEVGDLVRVRALDPSDFHRVPNYVRGCSGRVLRRCGTWAPPRGHRSAGDRASGQIGAEPEDVYTVEFTMQAVFAAGGDDRIFVDLWSRYLGSVSRKQYQ